MSASWIPTPLIPEGARRPVRLVEPGTRKRRRGLRRRLFCWVVRFAASKLRGQSPSAKLAQDLASILSDTGGVSVKIGQLLSLRPDIFSAEFCNVLAELQFQFEGFPPEVARETIEAELGRPLEEIFDFFEELPLAAASIAQVHRARLRGQQNWVAVKVQRPGVAEDFARDVAVVRRWVNRLRRFDSLAHLCWDDFLWELERTIMEEVDYRYETANLKRMRKTLKKHRVRTPKLYDCSTSKVLVMEFVPGVLMSDIIDVGQRDPERLQQWMQENHVDLEKVGENLFLSFQRQVTEDNLFHGDLHPGNILVLRDSKLALIDFGSTGSLDPETVSAMGHYNRAIADQDFVAAADYMLLLSGRIPRMDIEKFRPQVARVFRSWLRRSCVEGLSYKEKAVSEAGLEISRMIAKHKMYVSWEFMRVNRASVTLEASLRFLQPNADQARQMARYVKDSEKRHQRGWAPRLREHVAELPRELAFAADLQERQLRDRGRAVQAAMSKASHAAIAVFGILQLVAVLVLMLGLVKNLGWFRLPTLVESWPVTVIVFIGVVAFFFANSLRRFCALPDVKP